jgi:hypothetical protein
MLPLDTADEETIGDIIYHCDNILQYGDHREADEKAYRHAESKMNGEAEEEERERENDADY